MLDKENYTLQNWAIKKAYAVQWERPQLRPRPQPFQESERQQTQRVFNTARDSVLS